MIQSVTIKDFQSIEDLTLDFAPGFNVLVGPSNSGKSAVLRAVKGALRNEIAPSFVRNGSRKASISIAFDDHTIGADRGKSLSTYHLDDEEFTKCGKDVPSPIVDVLKMNLVNGEDLNFQFQFDSPFLISSSGSTVAQVIGTLTNVTLLFHAIQEANRRYLRASSELTIRLNDIESQKNLAGQFTGLDKRLPLLPVLEEQVSKYKEITTAQDVLARLLGKIKTAQDSMPVKVEIPDLDAEFSQLHQLEEMNTQMTTLTNKILTTTASIRHWKQSLEEVKEILNSVQDDYCPTCGQRLP